MASADPSPSNGSAAVRDALLATGEAVERDVDDLANELAGLLHAEIPPLGSDPAAVRETVRTGRIHMLALVQAIRRDERLDLVQPLPEASAFARATVRRGVPLSLVLRVFSMSHGFVLQAWEERLAAIAPDQDTVVGATQRLVALTFAFFDGLSLRLSEEYERERDRWVRGAQALRAELVRAIVAGEPVDLDGAGRVLGYELRREHTGLVIWAEPDSSDEGVLPVLETVAVEVAAALGCQRPLVLGAGTGRVWAWAGTDAPPDLGRIEALTTPRADGVNIALGDPAGGVDGFRRTHRDAADAARVAMVAGRRPGSVVRYRSVQLGALLSGDLERTARYVREQLGALAAGDDASARLRVTLKVYLEEHASRIAAARRLGIHQNTVANRVKTCRDLLGHDLSTGVVDLQVALTLAQTLGDAVLVGDG